jgi:hypothetical protein
MSMNKLLQLLGLFREKKTALIAAARRNTRRPILECLEDRTVPSTLSSITSNFNGTAIPAGDTLWFSSVFKASGLGSAPVHVHVTNQVISFSTSGTNYNLNVPDSDVTLSPTTSTGTTSFDAGQNAWVSNLPSTFSGNAFLGGFALPVPGGLPGGINPVTWSANFATDTAGVKINWQWAAAVYTSFATDYNALNVKPLDSNSATVYHNSDHAGTPEAFRGFVIGGARGGGGSNYSGSYSATASVTPAVENFQPATLAGRVTDASGAAVSGATLTLTGTDSHGVAFTLTATTDGSGNYFFSSVSPGTNYTVTLASSGSVTATPGTVNGVTDGVPAGTQIGQINLNAGDAGVEYNFSLGIVTGVIAA